MVLSAWIFSRWMAFIYLAAFWSLGVQILGLVGSHGILPVGDFLQAARQQELHPYWAQPTFCWFNHSDGFLLFLCWGGMLLSVLMLFGVWPAMTALGLWLFYLSLTVAGQDFLGFQWDNLLLEAGFLLIFLFPKPFSIHLKPAVHPSIVLVWLLRLLLFKLMLESGLVKFLSGDPNWRNLTALTYHYWTQPLPHVVSWYVNQLPLWFQKFSCFVLFVIELIFPWLILGGRWCRLIAFFGLTSLQLLIILTGNYCFFNWLAIGLCMTLLEDEHFSIFSLPLGTGGFREGGLFYKIITRVIAVIVLTVSFALMAGEFLRMPLPASVQKLIMAVEPLRSINNYGLFAVMTTQRNEIILEGSRDGEHWTPYEFRYKPGNVDKAPQWVAPFQPRLDWQMWFASLGSWRDNQWVLTLMERLLQGEPSVIRLLAVDPFAGHPPKYMRAVLWAYHFTDFKTKAQTGAWWTRDAQGLWCPTVSLR
jgi:hypothetical protein